MNKNHEGYRDPTAYQAIRRCRRKRRSVTKSDALTYRIGEISGFKKARGKILR